MTAPPDHQLVVRGGSLAVVDLERSAKLCQARRYGAFGWSVFSVPATSPVELLEKVAECFPHEKVAFATMGTLRDHGLLIEQTGQPEHFTVTHSADDDLNFAVVQFRTSFTLPVSRDKVHEVKVF